MITTLKKLTANNNELEKKKLNKIRGLGCYCGYKCDLWCGTKVGNDGKHYSVQKSVWESPIG